MASSPCSGRAALAAFSAVALSLGGAVANAQAPEPRTVRTFEAPDGSRFVLVRDANLDQVHWAIASWADGRDDPPGLPGLALTTARTSLNGTWPTGSRDPEAERVSLAQLDDAWQRQMASPQDAKIAREIIALDESVAQLGDARTFQRVLAALPVHRPEVLERGPLAVLVLTTLGDAVPEVAKLMVERREQQALRGLYRTWMQDLLQRVQRQAEDPTASLHAELVALTMPLAPAARMLAPPPFEAPTRTQAQATWQASQHPTRTTQVLLGNFDLDDTERALSRAFASTALPPPGPGVDFAPRPMAAQRRSIVPGTAGSRLAIAWHLPPTDERQAIDVACRWLAGDGRGFLDRRLARQGLAGVSVRCRAPWPPAEAGRSLLLLDVHDPSNSEGLLDKVLAACRAAAREPLDDEACAAANTALQRRWNTMATDPRQLVATMAEQAMLWPDRAVPVTAPPRVEAAAVRAILKALASQPAIVEGRK